MMKTIVTVIGLFLFSTIIASEKIYKWVDASGQTHYSSKKPETIASQEMKVKISKSTPTQSPTEVQTDKPPDPRIAQHYTEKKEAQKRKDERKQKCKRSSQRLKEIQNLGKCGWYDSRTRTNYEHLGDDMRNKIIKTTKKEINKYCK